MSLTAGLFLRAASQGDLDAMIWTTLFDHSLPLSIDFLKHIGQGLWCRAVHLRAHCHRDAAVRTPACW